MSPSEQTDTEIRDLEKFITVCERWFEMHGRTANKKRRAKRAKELDEARIKYAAALRKSMQAALT